MKPANPPSPFRNWSRLLLGGLAALWMGQALAADSTSNAPPARSLAAFKLITERNIFNPNRRVGIPEGSRSSQTVRPVRTEGISLTGTMIYEQGSYAFFDGSETKYRAALQCSNTLAGLTLVEIGPNQVKFLTGSNTLELPIGMQLKRRDEGPWLLVAEPATWSARSDSSPNESTSRNFGSSRGFGGFGGFGSSAGGGFGSSAGGSSGSSTGGSSGSSAGGSSDEILKRLMKQREQELNK
jgi:hypothetical protein